MLCQYALVQTRGVYTWKYRLVSRRGWRPRNTFAVYACHILSETFLMKQRQILGLVGYALTPQGSLDLGPRVWVSRNCATDCDVVA